MIIRNLKTEYPDYTVLIQTENTGVKRVFREALRAISIDETLRRGRSLGLGFSSSPIKIIKSKLGDLCFVFRFISASM